MIYLFRHQGDVANEFTALIGQKGTFVRFAAKTIR